MFEYLKDFQYIFVSGMQRSGTTPCMKMIQWDLEIPQCIWVGPEPKRVQEAIEEFPGQKLIFHSPGIAHLLHEIPPTFEEKIAIVWLKRDRWEVIKSAERVTWMPHTELETYNLAFEKDGFITNADISDLKKAKDALWEKQKEDIPHWFEIEHESLKEHPLWIRKEDRIGFHVRQTSLNSKAILMRGEKKVFSYSETGDLKTLLQECPKDDPTKWIPPWE